MNQFSQKFREINFLEMINWFHEIFFKSSEREYLYDIIVSIYMISRNIL